MALYFCGNVQWDFKVVFQLKLLVVPKWNRVLCVPTVVGVCIDCFGLGACTSSRGMHLAILTLLIFCCSVFSLCKFYAEHSRVHPETAVASLKAGGMLNIFFDVANRLC